MSTHLPHRLPQMTARQDKGVEYLYCLCTVGLGGLLKSSERQCKLHVSGEKGSALPQVTPTQAELCLLPGLIRCGREVYHEQGEPTCRTPHTDEGDYMCRSTDPTFSSYSRRALASTCFSMPGHQQEAQISQIGTAGYFHCWWE